MKTATSRLTHRVQNWKLQSHVNDCPLSATVLRSAHETDFPKALKQNVEETIVT